MKKGIGQFHSHLCSFYKIDRKFLVRTKKGGGMFYREFYRREKKFIKILFGSRYIKKIIQTYKCEKKYGKLADSTKLSFATKNFDGGRKKIKPKNCY